MNLSTPQTISSHFLSRLQTWQPASWNDYTIVRDNSNFERIRLFFDRGKLWIDMGAEGINHASISDLFTMLFFIWSIQNPEQTFTSLGRCLLEKLPQKAGAPDLVLYVGEDYPRWQLGETRRIDLNQWKAPDLVGEISDTTLATDLDKKKKIYADLKIPEYWVIDVQGERVLIFQLQDNQKYMESSQSKILAGLPISLLNEALKRLNDYSNTQVAAWLRQQISVVL